MPKGACQSLSCKAPFDTLIKFLIERNGKMQLYIGGFAQGKLSYVKGRLAGKQIEVMDGAELTLGETWQRQEKEGELVFYHFHLWIRRLMEQGKDAEDMARKLIEEHPDIWIISDEVGNGIVPMEPFEREYRERLGRILIQIAADAGHVERVICGMGQTLK